MNKEQTKKIAGISDQAVINRTGKSWKEWFKLLDGAGAKKMNHTQIADYLYTKFKVSGWWSQMIAVNYEQARGLREKYQTPAGYQISVSRIVAVPVSKVYSAWQDEKTRNRWLSEKNILIHKATANKSMRVTWIDGKKSVEVNFYPKGNSKSQVVVQHNKLPDTKQVEKMKSYWANSLDRLKEILET